MASNSYNQDTLFESADGSPILKRKPIVEYEILKKSIKIISNCLDKGNYMELFYQQLNLNKFFN